jgi:nucleoside-diphosphate-sugar epimerase
MTMGDTIQNVLLTGANGFVGNHILEQLLNAGVRVRAAVRSEAKASNLKRDHPNAKFDTVVIEDLTIPGAFNAALQESPLVDIVVHTASPFLYSAASGPRDFLDPAIKGTSELLNSIQSTKNDVKRVIITSSFAAVGAFGQVSDVGKTYTSDDWNPTTWEEANATTDLGYAYRASKKFAEKAGKNIDESETII